MEEIRVNLSFMNEDAPKGYLIITDKDLDAAREDIDEVAEEIGHMVIELLREMRK